MYADYIDERSFVLWHYIGSVYFRSHNSFHLNIEHHSMSILDHHGSALLYLCSGHRLDWLFKTSTLLVQVLNTFRDLEESNILRSYMSDAIKEIYKACQAFEVKESAPSIAGSRPSLKQQYVDFSKLF